MNARINYELRMAELRDVFEADCMKNYSDFDEPDLGQAMYYIVTFFCGMIAGIVIAGVVV